MYLRRLMLLMIVLLMAVAALHASAANGADTVKPPEIKKFSNHIYRITFPFSIKTNIGVSIGENGVLLVDTGFKRL